MGGIPAAVWKLPQQGRNSTRLWGTNCTKRQKRSTVEKAIQLQKIGAAISWLNPRQFPSSEEHLKTRGFRILVSVCHSTFSNGIRYRGHERAHSPVYLFLSKGTLSVQSNRSHKPDRTPRLWKLNVETPLWGIINSSFHFILELWKIMSASAIITHRKEEMCHWV